LGLPSCDVIYVNAGVACPPASWLRALRPGGRMIFPWHPAERAGLTMLLTRSSGHGFSVKPLMRAWFIPCVGASSAELCIKAPSPPETRLVRSAWLSADRKPDDTAIAVYREMWFSYEEAGRQG